MDEMLTQIFLFLHIAGGSLSLLTGGINLVRHKGGAAHVKTGLVFYYSMLATGVSAIILSILNPNSFLTIIGVFTLYMVMTGRRYKQWKNALIQNPGTIGWFLTGGMIIAGLIFLVLGTRAMISGNMFGIVYIVFGGIGLLFAKADMTFYRGLSRYKLFWKMAHLQRMTGSYIAACTAFLVVNLDKVNLPIPSVLAWLLPTMVLTLLIVKWSREIRE